MTPEATVTAQLDDEDLARVDALAEQKGVSREEMLMVVVRSGLKGGDQEDAPPTTREVEVLRLALGRDAGG